MKHIHFNNGKRNFLDKEDRLLWRIGNPETETENPQEGEENNAQPTTPERQNPRNVDNQRAQINDRIQQTAGREMNQVPKRTSPMEHLSNARAALPSVETTAKGLGTAAVIANPIVGVPVVAGAVGVAKGWGFLKKFPGFKQADSFARWVGRGTINGVKSAGKLAASPFVASWHVTKAVGEVGYQAFDRTVGEFFRDISIGLVRKYPGLEDVNLLSASVLGLKKLAMESVKLPFRLGGKVLEGVMKVAENLASKPIPTALGVALAIGAFSNPAAIIPIFDKLVVILGNIVSAIPGVP